MGLDFGIEKKRKGKAYASLAWEEAHESWRNCYDVKYLFIETLGTHECHKKPITIGAMQVLIKKMSDELQNVDFNDIRSVDIYRVPKLLCAIEDLSKILNEAIYDYEKGIEYEYRIFDSY